MTSDKAAVQRHDLALMKELERLGFFCVYAYDTEWLKERKFDQHFRTVNVYVEGERFHVSYDRWGFICEELLDMYRMQFSVLDQASRDVIAGFFVKVRERMRRKKYPLGQAPAEKHEFQAHIANKDECRVCGASKNSDQHYPPRQLARIVVKKK